MNTEESPLSFHFHLDPRIILQRNSLHFHVVLDEARITAVPFRQQNYRGTSFCLPPTGNPVQDVRDLGSGNGSICVIGYGTVEGENPDCVYAKIYSSSDDIPDEPPSGTATAQLVNIAGEPPFRYPGCDDINFVFHKAFPAVGELEGAFHAYPTPATNILAVWLEFGTTINLPIQQPFRGLTALNSECSGSGGSSLVLRQRLKTAGPEKYVVTPDGPSTPFDLPVTLHRVRQPQGEFELAWKSCPKKNPEVDCQLWVGADSNGVRGTLVIHGVHGRRFESPLIWRSVAWNFDGPNRLAFDGLISQSARSTITIAPA